MTETEEFTGRAGDEHEALFQRLALIINFFYLCCFVVPTNRALIAFMYPTRSEYISSSFVENDSDVSFTFRIINLILSFQVVGFILTTLMLNFCIILCIVFSLFLSIQWLSSESTFTPLSTKSLQHFRILQVIEAEIIEHYGYSILSYQVIGIIGTTWQLFQGIVFHSIRGIMLGAGVLICANEYMKFCSKIQENANELILNWKINSKNNGYTKKYCKSCRAIRVPIGNFFYYDRSLKLTTLRIVFDSFMNLVIVFNKS